MYISNQWKKLSSSNELTKEVRPNAHIEIVRRCCHGASLSVGIRAQAWQLKSTTNPSRLVIYIKTVHFSYSSNEYQINEGLVGFIAYSFTNQETFQLYGHRRRTGYILIKATTKCFSCSK